MTSDEVLLRVMGRQVTVLRWALQDVQRVAHDLARAGHMTAHAVDSIAAACDVAPVEDNPALVAARGRSGGGNALAGKAKLDFDVDALDGVEFTDDERRVLDLRAAGMTLDSIAQELDLSRWHTEQLSAAVRRKAMATDPRRPVPAARAGD